MSSVADRYRRLSAHFTSVIDAVAADRWTAVSPCEGWTAVDVVEHVVSTELDFLRRQPFGPSDTIDIANPRTAWPLVRELMQTALDDPTKAGYEYDGYFGRTTFAATANDFYNADLVIHAWDLASAAGVHEYLAIDANEMIATKAGLESLEATLRQPGLFGPELPTATDASDQTKFLAFFGRSG